MPKPRLERDAFNNKQLKTVLLQTLFNAAALLPLLCYGLKHYMSDSYLVAYHYDWHLSAFVGACRYFGALLIRVWTALFDPVKSPLMDAVIFILFSAAAVTLLSRLLFRKLGLRGGVYLAAADLAALVSVANVFLCNVLCFPECIFPLSVAVLFCFCAVYVYFCETLSPWVRLPVSGALLICCTAVYQQFLTIFAVYALLLTALELIRSEDAAAKTALIAYLKLFLFAFVCTAVYYAVGVGVQKAMHIGSNPRAAFTAQSILDNVKYYLTHQRGILGGKGLFETNLLRRSFEALALLWLAGAALYLRRHKITAKTVLAFLAFPAAYACVFFVGVISDPGGVRVIMALFSVFALLGVSAMALSQSRKLACCLIALLLFVFSLNTYKNLQAFYSLSALNAREIPLTKQYLYEIDRYEAETGITVTSVVFGGDAAPGECAGNAYAADWGAAGILDYVSGGRLFNVRYLTEEERSRYFGDRDWTVYLPEEQLVFEGDTLYLCVY